MTYSFNVRSDLYRAVAVVRSTKETRYYLQGVFIHPHPVEGVYLVATDGHRLLAAHDPDGSCSEAVIVAISGDAFKAGKAKRTDHIDGRRFVAENDAAVRVVLPGESAREYECSWRVDGSYPDWQRVLPRADRIAGKQVLAGYNPAYLGDFAKALSELLITQPVIALRATDATGPSLVTFGPRDDIFGVIMPVKMDLDRTLFPFFMSPNYRKREQAA